MHRDSPRYLLFFAGGYQLRQLHSVVLWPCFSCFLCDVISKAHHRCVRSKSSPLPGVPRAAWLAYLVYFGVLQAAQHMGTPFASRATLL